MSYWWHKEIHVGTQPWTLAKCLSTNSTSAAWRVPSFKSSSKPRETGNGEPGCLFPIGLRCASAWGLEMWRVGYAGMLSNSTSNAQWFQHI